MTIPCRGQQRLWSSEHTKKFRTKLIYRKLSYHFVVHSASQRSKFEALDFLAFVRAYGILWNDTAWRLSISFLGSACISLICHDFWNKDQSFKYCQNSSFNLTSIKKKCSPNSLPSPPTAGCLHRAGSLEQGYTMKLKEEINRLCSELKKADVCFKHAIAIPCYP